MLGVFLECLPYEISGLILSLYCCCLFPKIHRERTAVDVIKYSKFLRPNSSSKYLNFVSVNGFKTSNRIECGLIITASRIL